MPYHSATKTYVCVQFCVFFCNICKPLVSFHSVQFCKPMFAQFFSSDTLSRRGQSHSRQAGGAGGRRSPELQLHIPDSPPLERARVATTDFAIDIPGSLNLSPPAMGRVRPKDRFRRTTLSRGHVPLDYTSNWRPNPSSHAVLEHIEVNG